MDRTTCLQILGLGASSTVDPLAGSWKSTLRAGLVERGVERERTMPIVLEAMALGAPRAKRQHRVEAIEGFGSRLFPSTIPARARRV